MPAIVFQSASQEEPDKVSQTLSYALNTIRWWIMAVIRIEEFTLVIRPNKKSVLPIIFR